MPRRSDTKRARLQAYFDETNPSLVDEDVWSELERRLSPISEGYLRQLLRSSGHPLSPIVEGVRHESLDEAARTLTALTLAYCQGAADARQRVRRTVIESKNHLRWSMKRTSEDPQHQAMKSEMLLWTLTWLENPEVFPTWLSLRKRSLAAAATESGSPRP
jgi:hypothetical protein